MEQRTNSRRNSYSSNSKNSRYSNNRRPSGGRRPSSSSRGKTQPKRSLKSLNAELAKYLSKAQDAKSSGDIVGAENFFQHADHFFRLIEVENEANEAKENNLKKKKAEKEAQEENNKKDDDSETEIKDNQDEDEEILLAEKDKCSEVAEATKSNVIENEDAETLNA